MCVASGVMQISGGVMRLPRGVSRLTRGVMGVASGVMLAPRLASHVGSAVMQTEIGAMRTAVVAMLIVIEMTPVRSVASHLAAREA